jgi:nucleoside 2-deoxyribosyltransferase
VYLAGPIGKLSYEDATDWRVKVTNEIKSRDKNVECYDPMRFKEFLSKYPEMSTVRDTYSHPLASARGIMHRDFFDCNRAAVVFVNFLPCRESGIPSLGTVMEIAWAYANHTPVIVVADEDDVHLNHPMISEAISYKVRSLDEGVDLLHAVLGTTI